MSDFNYEGWSDRAKAIYKRTYARPKDDGTLEDWDETVDRVISHQQWLWERALGRRLRGVELEELGLLRGVILARKAAPAGRSLWLAGTEISRTRESSQFNCAFSRIETVNDFVDLFWLLLQGCGVGFKPVSGSLYGFIRPLELEIVPSTRTEKGGDSRNWEYYDKTSGVWTVRVGDSAEAWAKALGKILAHPYPATKLVMDFSQVRPAGGRLAGYGWLCNGSEPFIDALEGVIKLLNLRAGSVLNAIDILDIINYMGTVLSSRRSAQIALMDSDHEFVYEFATAKKEFWLHGNEHRQQSNNTVGYWNKPSMEELSGHFETLLDAGGSEPGIANFEQFKARAFYYAGSNPCNEIALPSKGFCNLVTVNLMNIDNFDDFSRVIRLIARANYRQTCVELRDGVLQDQWHHNNNFLRLTGVSLLGQAGADSELLEYALSSGRNLARSAAHSMADELELPRSVNVTTVKPEGTISKVFDATEGIHVPLGMYIFNNVKYSIYDPMIPNFEAAGYRMQPAIGDPMSVVVAFPQKWKSCARYFTEVDGTPVNLESAVEQLERYKDVMRRYVDHNCSITVSYSVEEVPEIVQWLYDNWDDYVGVSFLLRADPTKTAKDLGYAYLPQEVVTKEKYDEYVVQLKPLNIHNRDYEELEDDCISGACPVR